MQEKITIYHDPNVPIEETGQGTTPNIAGLIFIALDNSWYTHIIPLIAQHLQLL